VAEGEVASVATAQRLERWRRVVSARRPLTLRVLCHLAVEFPIALTCLLELARGWRPQSDNALLSWRAYDVLGASPPLVGMPTLLTAGSVHAYGPGPLEFWLLALPVHIDPLQGALWGSAVLALGAVGTCVEAAWSVGRARACVPVAAGIVWLFITWPQVASDPPWNPWFAVIWFLPTLGAAWSTASGRLRWWPVTVAAGSIAMQAHEIFLLPGAVVVVVSPLVGLAQLRRQRAVRPARRSSLFVGVCVGVAAWLAPLLQQFLGRQGNLTALWRSTHAHVGTMGLAAALSGFASVTRPIALWWHRPAESSARQTLGTLTATYHGAEWWGVTVLVLLGVVAVVSWRRYWVAGCAAALVALASSVAVLMALAAVPATQILVLSYLDVILWPVGMLAWGTLVWMAGATLHDPARRVVGSLVRRLARRPPGVAWRPAALAMAAMVVLTAWCTVQSGASQVAVDSDPSVQQAAVIMPVLLEEAPHTPFGLNVVGWDPDTHVAVLSQLAYTLHLDGYQPHFLFDYSLGIPNANWLPAVFVHIERPDGTRARFTVRVERSRSSPKSRAPAE
jgi:hypothetical protein